MPQVVDIGVDLGTASVVIFGKGKGLLLNEPAVIAVDRTTRNVIAVGSEARRMMGRTPGNIIAMRPLQNGSVEDLQLACTMLNSMVRRVTGKHLFNGPRVILTLPAGVNEVERRSIAGALFDPEGYCDAQTPYRYTSMDDLLRRLILS